MSYIIMIIAAIFVNNIVLAQFLGICPFLGVSKKVDTAAGMGMAVAFVMLLATLVTWPVYYFVLVHYGLQLMQTLVYILVIAALVEMVEIILTNTMLSLYSALGVFLPLITTNCTILGVAINVINFEYTLLESAVYAVATALGFSLAMVLFAGIREQIAVTDVPKGMKGTPIALLIAGLLALAFMGFSGIDNTLKVMFNIG